MPYTAQQSSCGRHKALGPMAATVPMEAARGAFIHVGRRERRSIFFLTVWLNALLCLLAESEDEQNWATIISPSRQMSH